MSKHTAGPWHLAQGNNGDPTSVYAPNGEIVGQYIDNPADLVLIAAAPELLDALAMFVNAVNMWQDDYSEARSGSEFIALCETTAENARNVIAKATGEAP